ncbi:hypothetical protein [Pedobacter sp.]|uniref:hypothetical protein n=1 Tax=Pedobacter sp. TaxID=1411316 RepID=UPI003D7F5473
MSKPIRIASTITRINFITILNYLLTFSVLFLLSALPISSFAQSLPTPQAEKPERQISFAKENKSHAYYVKQAELWWKEVEKDKSSETNWYNYYRACRSAQGTFDWKEDFVKESPALRLGDDIVKLMEKYIPHTFTYNYVLGSTGGVNPYAGQYLMKAYAMNPDFEGIHADVITYAQSIGDTALRAKANQEWHIKKDMSPGLLSYAYNLLMSVDEESILLTQHDNDSYPVWMLQDVLGIKKSVKVINIDFLILESYRKQVFKELDMSQTDLPGKTINEWEANWKSIVDYILSNYKGKKALYVSLTLFPDLYQKYLPQLSTSGLALKLGKKPLHITKQNLRLIEDDFLLDDLKIQVAYEPNTNFVNEQNLNYLKSFKLVHAYYKQTKQVEKAKRIKALSLLIANNAENKKLSESVQTDFK